MTPDEDIGKYLMETIYRELCDHEASRPRSRQIEPGPSEIGHPCDRRLAHMAAHSPRSNVQKNKWPAMVGSALHEWVKNVLEPIPAWAPEKKVEMDQGNTYVPSLTGSSDIYHHPTKTVVDNKFTSKATRDAAKREPSIGYRRQVNLYGIGWQNAGFEVENVAILYWPTDSKIDERYAWSAKFDPSFAQEALDRWKNIAKAAHLLDVNNHPKRFDSFEKSADACLWCPYYKPSENVNNSSFRTGHACSGVSTKLSDWEVLLGSARS